MRIGILVSHPIQYYTPLFRILAEQIDLRVFYATRGSRAQQAKAGFGVEFDWDVDLLSGYPHTFLDNVSADPGPRRFRGCDTPGIARQIEQGNYDAFVVFGWYLKSHWQAIRACRRLKVPVLVRGDSQLRGQRSTLKIVAKEVTHRLMLRQFNGYLAVGTRNREYLLHYGAPAERIFSSPHFVDNAWFAAEAEKARDQRGQIRRHSGVPDHAFCLLFCGKFIPNKCPLDLVRAAQFLITNNSLTDNLTRSVHLLFVGSGELGPELRRNCNVVFDADNPNTPLPPNNQQQLSNNPKPTASFTGFQNQSQLPALYAIADAVVLPSQSETWGLTVNEGMACGVPAIVSNAVGCAPDMIDEGQTGFTFPLGNVEPLAGRITELMALKESGFNFNDLLRAKLKRYSPETAAEGIVKGTSYLQKGRVAAI